MCTWNLGPFGHIPIPTLFGMCMGSKKDFGSHIGDWEHMSLSFKGRKEPDVSILDTLEILIANIALRFRKCMYPLMMLEHIIHTIA